MEEEDWITVGKEKKPKKVKTKPVKQNKENKKKEKVVLNQEKQGITKREVVPLPHDQNHSYSTPTMAGSPQLDEYTKEELEKKLAELGDSSNNLPPPLMKVKKRIEVLLERIERKEQQEIHQKKISVPSTTTIETNNNNIQPIELTQKSNVNIIIFLIIIFIIVILIFAYTYPFN
ncbi:hypothetical protein EDI_127160 [Entamoeba dispar SAW760]|uniref:Uncharacterized protein n=1 Tax=Entamoeba dispar (strain ATCC PRA-260 / SAW760) TaxID=370354 RepID=B0E8K7_ENTDS|nr:uncharacterized protein EDI_127160 [Entamoeba dispar SAW760]EDR29150.1 hypothetical protein EDI_127160 [Entamoeba dispar SAW760]|eukprot:EDR29150.1 hypothetical protein EDI_127160 [Entamoeba dispar SAW760]